MRTSHNGSEEGMAISAGLFVFRLYIYRPFLCHNSDMMHLDESTIRTWVGQRDSTFWFVSVEKLPRIAIQQKKEQGCSLARTHVGCGAWGLEQCGSSIHGRTIVLF